MSRITATRQRAIIRQCDSDIAEAAASIAQAVDDISRSTERKRRAQLALASTGPVIDFISDHEALREAIREMSYAEEGDFTSQIATVQLERWLCTINQNLRWLPPRCLEDPAHQPAVGITNLALFRNPDAADLLVSAIHNVTFGVYQGGQTHRVAILGKGSSYAVVSAVKKPFADDGYWALNTRTGREVTTGPLQQMIVFAATHPQSEWSD